MLNMKELQTWDIKVVRTKISELKSEAVQIKMQKATSGIEKPHRLKEIKKDVARLMTVLAKKN